MEQPSNLFDLQLDQPSINYLNESARWAKFLSIIGFIYCGLLVIAALFIGTIISMLPGGETTGMGMMGTGFFTFFFLAFAAIMFFPALYLFNFSNKVRRGLNNNEQVVLTDGLKNLKSFFKFYGIILIIFLSLYALAFIAGIVGALVGHH